MPAKINNCSTLELQKVAACMAFVKIQEPRCSTEIARIKTRFAMKHIQHSVISHIRYLIYSMIRQTLEEHLFSTEMDSTSEEWEL